jgi:ABC-2 type transport system permease protein
MRTIRFLLEKEFRQIFRNKTLAIMIFFVPVVQLLILPLAANYEVKNISLAIVDLDHSQYSNELTAKITASGYFRLSGVKGSFDEAFRLIEADEADLILEIPQGFEAGLIRENRQKLFVAVNAINGVKANLGGAYLQTIIREYNNEIALDWAQPDRMSQASVIDVTSSNWFNPHMDYHLFMVPGILAILVTMIGGYLSALNIVKEKEIGTIEQINVTPIRKHHFILGKLIPFWVLGMVIFTIGLFTAWAVYRIVPQGNLAVLYLFLSIYLLAVLGFGLLISTFTDTQQQAMFISFFFVMIFILMGGLFTSIDSMPVWAQVLSRLNPVSYFIDVMRMVVLKGSGLRDIVYQLGAAVLFAIVFNVWAVLNYKKTS